jgi:hypothetical protein
MGMTLELKDPPLPTPASQELPAFSLTDFSPENLMHPAPVIQPLEDTPVTTTTTATPVVKEEAQKGISSESSSGWQQMRQIMTDPEVLSARRGVLDAWTSFRTSYTGGDHMQPTKSHDGPMVLERAPTMNPTTTTLANAATTFSVANTIKEAGAGNLMFNKPVKKKSGIQLLRERNYRLAPPVIA